ncbi:MAG: DUF2231 domain-containing protein [Caldilineaceae bacterium]
MPTNLHPASVHFPIALLLLGAVAGLLHLYWRPQPTLQTLTWWPLLLGWLSNGVAILTGLLAQSGLPPQAPYRAILNWHVTTGFVLWLLNALLLYWWWLHGKGRSRRRRRGAAPLGEPGRDLLLEPTARLWLTLGFAGGILLIIASGWNGGKLVYEWGVNVMPH